SGSPATPRSTPSTTRSPRSSPRRCAGPLPPPRRGKGPPPPRRPRPRAASPTPCPARRRTSTAAAPSSSCWPRPPRAPPRCRWSTGCPGSARPPWCAARPGWCGRASPTARSWPYCTAATRPAPPRDPGEVLYELLAAVGLAPADVPEGTEARAALWRTVTASRRCLLVLDDAAGPEQVRPLLPGGDGCAVVVTSRWRPDGLEGARLLHLAPPPLDEAVRLLADAAGCDPALHRDRLVTLARGLGRLPLALRVAAEGHRRAPADPPGARPSPLPAEGRGGAVLQVLDGAFDACLAALSPAARTAFVRLGLLPSPVFGVQA